MQFFTKLSPQIISVGQFKQWLSVTIQTT